MASILRGNCVVAQSGGPTAVTNASLAGIIQEALQYEEIEEIYGALNGIPGVLNEEFVDLTEEKNKTIEALLHTPSAILGSCRYRLKKPEESKEDYQRILEVFQQHNIRYFFCIGGNDSMETADKINKFAQEAGYELRILGVPKAIENDLTHTDHCPGYGSAIKFLSAIVTEAGRDCEAMATAETASVIEVMGGGTGWLAAGTVLARRTAADAPHLILVPEVPFVEERFIGQVAQCLTKNNRAVIVVAEGMKDASGKLLSQVGGSFAKDVFGRPQLGGVCNTLRRIIEDKIGVKCRTSRPGILARCAGHLISRTDRDEAVLCGQAAVQAAIEGKSGYMITLERAAGGEYQCGTGLAPLLDVACREKPIPTEWLDEMVGLPNQAFVDYARPLIQGEVPVPFEDGLPRYARLERNLVERKCLLREVPPQ